MAGQEEQLMAPGQDWEDYGYIERNDHDPSYGAAVSNSGGMATSATVQGEFDPNDNLPLYAQEVAFGD